MVLRAGRYSQSQDRTVCLSNLMGGKRIGLAQAVLYYSLYGNVPERSTIRGSDAMEESSVRSGRDCRAGARDWGEHGHLQRGQFGAAAAAAVSRRCSPGGFLGNRHYAEL